ncbi:MAG TPA: hypothetical protein VGH61_06715 [Steroidobacteraceae bacterium]
MLEALEVVAAARPARVLTALLALSALAGCVHQTPSSPPPAAVPENSGPRTGTPAAAPDVTSTPAVPAAPAASANPAPGVASPPPPAPSAPVRANTGTATHAPAPKRPAPAPAAPGSAAAGPGPAASAAPPALDLASLEVRLRDTHAIGVFTKLSLKNQVDDLLAQFRAFYAGQGGLTLAGLRHSYELLLMKVATLLQDADPGLASAVSASREAIWAILSDRNRFNSL